MKAIEEIGIKKTFSFAAFSVIEIIYFLMIFPPFRKIFLQVFGTEIGKNSVIMNVKFFNWYHLGLKGLKVGKECFSWGVWIFLKQKSLRDWIVLCYLEILEKEGGVNMNL